MNPRTGIVRRVTRLRGEPGDAPLYVVGADVAPPGRSPTLRNAVVAGGIGWDEETAVASALGEACERYAAAVHEPALSVFEAARDLEGAVTGWALFSGRQYDLGHLPFQPWSDGATIEWVRATRLADGSPSWVPRSFVGLEADHAAREKPFAPPYSTGLAAAPDPTTATLMALYEVVERDAFALTWLHAARPPELRPEDEPASVAFLRRFGSFRVFDITSDIGLPTYLAFLEKPSSVGTIRAVGAATRHDPAAAVEKAVLEAFQTFPYVRHLVRIEPDWRAGRGFENLVDFRDFCRVYTVHPEFGEGLAPMRETRDRRVALRPTPEPTDVAGRLRDAVQRLSLAGLSPYATEIATPDVAAAGIAVVRCLVPRAQPLHGHYQAPHLGGPRFREAGRALPFLTDPRTEENVNPWPHPFA